MDCKSYFEQLDALPKTESRGDNLRLAGQDQLLQWQHEIASPHSPSPVTDDEKLRLSLYEGRQVQSGKLARMAFNPLDKVGLSTDRVSLAPVGESLARAKEKAARDGKPAWGHVDLDVAHLRQIKDDGSDKGIVGVYDTAIPATAETPANISHAEAFLIVKATNTVPLKSVQANLMDAYSAQMQPWPDESTQQE